MAHGKAREDYFEFEIIDEDSDAVQFKKSECPEGCIFLAETSCHGVYLTKADTEAIISFLQSKLPELK